MGIETSARHGRRTAWMRRFVAETRANTMILTAFFIVPMMGLVGSGVDMARGYMAKTRLQQACDSAVLAGRRAMANGTYSATARAEASKMFSANYPAGYYGSSQVAFTSTADGANDVVGNATAQLPMAMMTLFGMDEFDLAVTCSARLEITNTDVMLVFDTTGSMDGTTTDGTVKIVALRDAAKAFFDAITATGSDGRIRIGMVPYSTTVNVGKILTDTSNGGNRAWISDTASMPSRAAWYDTYNRRWRYRYQNVTFPVLLSKNMSTPVTAPVGDGGGNVSEVWGGCIIERDTVDFGPTTTAPSGAYDMDVDLVPNANPQTQWSMMLPKLAFPRGGTGKPSNTAATGYVDAGDTNSYQEISDTGGDLGACPSESKRLREFTASDRSVFEGWVNGLTPAGFTYHDVGMAWGVRLISPTGLFASDNTSAPNGRPISRHIIFMTDGAMDNRMAALSHQNYEYTFKRVGGATETDLEARHDNRFQQLCNAAKSRNVTIWVVNLGIPNNASLTACASGDKVFSNYTAAQLRTTFEQIAQQISKLRLTE